MLFLSRVSTLIGGLVLASYLAASWLGWEPTGARRERLPSSARQSPGGYRSFHFWHSGFHGGK